MTTVAAMTANVAQWEQACPQVSGVRAVDAGALAQYTHRGEELLAALPAKPDRDPGQQRLAERVLASCRRSRAEFIIPHAEGVYATLRSGFDGYLGLSELAFAAAEEFSGLVPTRQQLGAERCRPQADKDGREIDQGIFFRGLLRAPVAGSRLIDAMLAPSPRALRLLADFQRDGLCELDSVSIERIAGAAHLTVHNVHCLNAEDDQLIEDMETAVDLALLDDGVRVGVLRGGIMTHPAYLGRRVFSAGINLKHLHDGKISFVDFLLRRELGYINKIARGMRAGNDPMVGRVHKPWVAAVDSFAIGGGMQLLLVFDRVIAAEDAYFSLPAAQEGIVPGAGNLRLTRLVGGRMARRIILSGQKIHARDPAVSLLCDEVVAPARMADAIASAVRELDNPAVIANREMLNLAEEPPELFRTYMAEFAHTQAIRLYSDDVIAKVARARSTPRKDHQADA